MYTVVETNIFHAKACRLWTPRQYEDFILYIARNPRSGDIIPGTGGVRKIRWRADGVGKRGGVRVVYFNSSLVEVWLLTLYAKNEKTTIPAHELKKIREAIGG